MGGMDWIRLAQDKACCEGYQDVTLTMRNVSDKICRENQNTHFVFKYYPPTHPPEIFRL